MVAGAVDLYRRERDRRMAVLPDEPTIDEFNRAWRALCESEAGALWTELTGLAQLIESADQGRVVHL